MASKLFKDITHFSYGKRGRRNKIPTATIDEYGKIVGLYYSAYWCPACIDFTTKVVHWYEKILSSGPPRKSLEVVFISFDRDEDEYNKHFDNMPWLAVPYEDKKICNKLSELFQVNNVPTLLLVDGATGTVITKEGKSIVDEDPNGDAFPWNITKKI